MATVSFADLGRDFDITARLVTYTGASEPGRFPADWFWTSPSPQNNYVQFSGPGFTYNDNGVPTGGTVNQFFLDLNPASPLVDLTITGLSFALTDLAPLADGSLTVDQENDLLWRTVLAGNDTINLANTSGTYGITFAGDGRTLTGSATLVGGDDTITGNVGGLSSYEGYVSGDFYTVAAGASLFGGDDRMTVAGYMANGDAFETLGAVIGGDDIMAVQAGGKLLYMVGDVEYVRAGGSLAGGDDRLDTTANGIGFNVYGDSYSVVGSFTGGDDTIIDGGFGSVLVGDARYAEGSAVARGGDDTIMGGGGDDFIYGDWGNVIAGARIRGGGNDKLYGEAGNDKLYGNEGDDLLDGGAGADALDGGTGSDTASYASAAAGVVASLANASINKGEAAGDTYSSVENLTGSAFADTLNGANGVNNTISGGAGDDTMKGYTGNDHLSGGAGNDTFVFNTTLNASTNLDTVTDFKNESGNNDRFLLDDAFFAGIVGDAAKGGELLSGFFKDTKKGAIDANDHLIYVQSSGNLYYDGNGSDAGERVLFAKVTPGTVLTYQDFFVN